MPQGENEKAGRGGKGGKLFCKGLFPCNRRWQQIHGGMRAARHKLKDPADDFPEIDRIALGEGSGLRRHRDGVHGIKKEVFFWNFSWMNSAR